jgi:hypothetical protein
LSLSSETINLQVEGKFMSKYLFVDKLLSEERYGILCELRKFCGHKFETQFDDKSPIFVVCYDNDDTILGACARFIKENWVTKIKWNHIESIQINITARVSPSLLKSKPNISKGQMTFEVAIWNRFEKRIFSHCNLRNELSLVDKNVWVMIKD